MKSTVPVRPAGMSPVRIKAPRLGACFALTLILIPMLTGNAAGCRESVETLYRTYHKQVSSVGDINDEMATKYARTIRLLRKEGIDFQRHIAEEPQAQKEGFSRIERVIQKGGFKDYAEFVRVNAKIAWAWNLAQAGVGMEQQKRLNRWAQDTTDAGVRQIDAALADQEVPEATKAELRKTRQELLEQKGVIREEWNKNKKWADWAMKMTLPLTNEKDMAVVRRHQSELMGAFTGLSKEELEAIQDHSMKQLGIQ